MSKARILRRGVGRGGSRTTMASSASAQHAPLASCSGVRDPGATW